MNMTMQTFMPALPEIILLVMICVVMLLDLFLKAQHRSVTTLLCQATLLVVAWVSYSQLSHAATVTFDGQFVLDHFAVVLKLFMLLMVFAVLVYGRHYVAEREIMRSEFHLLMLLSLLGGMVMVSAGSMITLYLGLELMALPTYAMVAMHRGSDVGPEAAMKYFVMGAIASGMLLYGMSLFYGVAGTLQLDALGHTINHGMSHSPILLFAMIFVVVGISFKFGLVPFHMWVPDVYQGAPTVVTALLGTMPKLAGFGFLVRLVIDPLRDMHMQWHMIFIVLAVLSLILGNLLAVAQKNIKRMLAYSTIAQMGFIFLGVALGTGEGLNAAMFYVVTYALTAAGAFGLLLLLSRKQDIDQIHDLAGLNKRHAWLAFLMLLLMFSMAGVPPLVGFDAKLMVLQALVAQQHYTLALVALLMSVIGAYYYIRVVKVMYFDQPEQELAVPSSKEGVALFSANAIAVLLLGIMPSGLLALCQVPV